MQVFRNLTIKSWSLQILLEKVSQKRGKQIQEYSDIWEARVEKYLILFLLSKQTRPKMYTNNNTDLIFQMIMQCSSGAGSRQVESPEGKDNLLE